MLEDRPRLNSHALVLAVLKDAAITHDARLIFHVDVEHGLESGCKRHAKLNLVCRERILRRTSDALHLEGILVRDTKLEDLACSVQLVKGLGYLIRLHQHVRAMQQKRFDVFRLEALETRIDRLDDVVLREVKVGPTLGKANGALSLQEDLVTQTRVGGKGLAEQLLAVTATIDVRGVHHVDALVKAGLNQLGHLGRRHLRYAHCSQHDLGNLRLVHAKRNVTHRHALLTE